MKVNANHDCRATARAPRAHAARWQTIALLALAGCAGPVGAEDEVLGASEALLPTTYTRTDDKAKTVLMVHGIEATGVGTNCFNAFNWNSTTGLGDKLAAQGFTGNMELIGFYWNDSNCDYYLYNEPINAGARIDTNTSIRYLGRLFAWYIYENYSINGEPVDIVAHSMGGIITRYALYRVAAQDPDFPPGLIVEDVVNTSSPHAGSTPLAQLCSTNTQCQELHPSSALMAELAANAQQPEGIGGTDWTLFSSEYDAIVNTTSARAMTGDHEPSPYPWTAFIGHNGYYSKSIVVEQDVPRALQYAAY